MLTYFIGFHQTIASGLHMRNLVAVNVMTMSIIQNHHPTTEPVCITTHNAAYFPNKGFNPTTPLTATVICAPLQNQIAAVVAA